MRLGLGWLTALDIRSLTLGMMPGGIAEMSLTAETLQLSVPLVTALQVLRLLLVLFSPNPPTGASAPPVGWRRVQRGPTAAI